MAINHKRYFGFALYLIIIGVCLSASYKFIPNIADERTYGDIQKNLNSLSDYVSDINEKSILDKRATQIGFDVSLCKSMNDYNRGMAKMYSGVGALLLIMSGIIMIIIVYKDKKC